MALNARWEELLGGTEPPGTADAPPAALTLAGLPAQDGGGGGGGGSQDLKADVGPWHQAGNTAGELRTSTGTSVTDLQTANEGVAGGTAGFDSTAALTEILGTWTTRLGSVRDECGRLEGSLKAAGRDFGEREEDNRRRIAADPAGAGPVRKGE